MKVICAEELVVSLSYGDRQKPKVITSNALESPSNSDIDGKS